MKFTPLPHYPSVRSRSTLPPSQLSTLQQNISTALNYLLSLPSTTYLATSSITYISSYAKDYAAQVLDSLIWESNAVSRIDLNFDKVERDIHRNTLYLAEKVAYSLDFQTLVDLSIVYGPSHSKRIRCLFELAFSKNPVLAGQVQREAVPAFVDLLRSSESGMYGLRKLSHIILSALRPSPPACLRIFAQNISFILALARPYHEELTAITHTYGGFRLPSHDNQLDDWQRIFLETKVSLIDAFHILVCYLFKDVATPQSATSTDDAFRFVFALVDLPPPTNLQDTLPTPFLNQSLLSDYEHAYDLSRTVAKVLHQANDPRTISLENTLQSIDSSEEGPGALKLLLRSSGIPPGIDNLGKGQSSTQVVAGSKGKGKAKDTSVTVEYDPALDTAVSQVLDILPEQDPDYIRYLLSHTDYPFKGNAERLIEAIFEGTAPPPEEVAAAQLQVEKGNNGEEFRYTGNRRNVFDEEDMDLNKVRIGKKAYVSTPYNTSIIHILNLLMYIQ